MKNKDTVSAFVVTKEYRQHASSHANSILGEFNSYEDAANYAVARLLDDNPDISEEKLSEAEALGVYDCFDYAIVIHRAEDVKGFEVGLKGWFEIDRPNCSEVARRQLVFEEDLTD